MGTISLLLAILASGACPDGLGGYKWIQAQSHDGNALRLGSKFSGKTAEECAQKCSTTTDCRMFAFMSEGVTSCNLYPAGKDTKVNDAKWSVYTRITDPFVCDGKSSETCAELGWDQIKNGVCGGSLGQIFSLGQQMENCPEEKTFYEARYICREHGARVCTLAELQARTTISTGCNFDRVLVWANDDCTDADDPGKLDHVIL